MSCRIHRMNSSRGIAFRLGTLLLLPSELVLFLLVRVYEEPSVLVLLLDTPDALDVYDVEEVVESMLDDEGPRERCSFSPAPAPVAVVRVGRLSDEEEDEVRSFDFDGRGRGR